MLTNNLYFGNFSLLILQVIQRLSIKISRLFEMNKTIHSFLYIMIQFTVSIL